MNWDSKYAGSVRMIEDLELGVRAYCGLKNQGLDTIDSVVSFFDRSELRTTTYMPFKNCGRVSAIEIAAELFVATGRVPRGLQGFVDNAKFQILTRDRRTPSLPESLNMALLGYGIDA